jgi:hypothetical protein
LATANSVKVAVKFIELIGKPNWVFKYWNQLVCPFLNKVMVKALLCSMSMSCTQ